MFSNIFFNSVWGLEEHPTLAAISLWNDFSSSKKSIIICSVSKKLERGCSLRWKIWTLNTLQEFQAFPESPPKSFPEEGETLSPTSICKRAYLVCNRIQFVLRSIHAFLLEINSPKRPIWIFFLMSWAVIFWVLMCSGRIRQFEGISQLLQQFVALWWMTISRYQIWTSGLFQLGRIGFFSEWITCYEVGLV